MEINQNEFKTQLKKNTVFVKFTKLNGEIREMRATLNQNLIPIKDDETSDGTTSKKIRRVIRENDSICKVYDLDNNGWRSFRWDSVIEYSYGD